MKKALLAAGLLLQMQGAEKLTPCALEQAQVATVPPDTFRVLATWRCAEERACWQRYVEVNGIRKGESIVCDKDKGDDLTTHDGS